MGGNEMAEIRYAFSDKITTKAATRMYDCGSTDREIADTLYITPSAVRKWRVRNGLPAVQTNAWRNAHGVPELRYFTIVRNRGKDPPLDTRNPACPVKEGDAYQVRPSCGAGEFGVWAGIPARYAGRVVRVYREHRWFLVEYEAHGHILREGFKF